MQIFIDIDAEVDTWNEDRAKKLWEVIEKNMEELCIISVEVRHEESSHGNNS